MPEIDETEFEDTTGQEPEVDESDVEEDKDWPAIVAKLRDENAKARIKLKEFDSTKEELQEIKRGQMTELEKAQDEARELRERLKPLQFEKDLKRAVKDSGLDPDYEDLLEGDYNSYDEILDKAKRLAARLPASKKDDTDDRSDSVADFFGGSAGKNPVVDQSGGDFLRGMWGNSKPVE